MASHTRFPGSKNSSGVYGAQYQHPAHLMRNPSSVTNVLPSPILSPGGVSNTSIYGVQPGHQGMISSGQIALRPAAYPTHMYGGPPNVNPNTMQRQMKENQKQKELHQQQQDKLKKEQLFQEQKQRLKNMTGVTKAKNLSVDALMDSYLKPSAMTRNPSQPVSWQPGTSSDNHAQGPVQPLGQWNENSATIGNSNVYTSQYSNVGILRRTDSIPSGVLQDRDVPETYLQILKTTVNATGIIDTGLLYPILLTSGLPRELLGHIWAIANKTILGQLTKDELFLALSMIGFIQSGNKPSDLSIFCQSPKPFPIMLSMATNPILTSQPFVPATVSKPVTASFSPLTPIVAPAPHVSLTSSFPLTSQTTLSAVAGPHSAIPKGLAASLEPSNPTVLPESFAAHPQITTRISSTLDSNAPCSAPSLGPQMLTSSSISQDFVAFSSPHPTSTGEPVNPQKTIFPFRKWDQNVSSVPIGDTPANPNPSQFFESGLKPEVPNSATISSQTSAAFSFPAPQLIGGQLSSQSLQASSLMIKSDPLVPPIASASNIPSEIKSSLPQVPILPTPLAAKSSDKYAAFKDLCSTETEDDFTDFVAADVKDREPAPALAPMKPEPAPVVAPPPVLSATDKIIENLNNFSISSKSRKSSSEEFQAFPASNNPEKQESEGWADFSQTFPSTSFGRGFETTPSLKQVPVVSVNNEPDEFGDFISTKTPGPQVTRPMHSDERAMAPPPPSNDGYHFSDPFFTPDHQGDSSSDFGGFFAFASKESTPVGDALGSSKSHITHFLGPIDASQINGSQFSRASSIAAETQSVSSLELPGTTCAASQSDSDSLNGQSTENNSVTSEDPGNSQLGGSGNSAPITNGILHDENHTMRYSMGPKTSLTGMPHDFSSRPPLIGDRYSCVLDDLSASERHAQEWIKCLQSCHRMIDAANTNLGGISSPVVCKEFIVAKKGFDYLSGIVEIYRVSCRISTSMKVLGIMNKELAEIMRNVEIVWQNLTSFLSKSPSIMPEPGALDFSNCVVKKSGILCDVHVEKLCGVCLLNVEGKSRAINPISGDAFKLSYAGRQYHASCANLWVNCVSPILPALVLPSPFL